MFAGSRPRHQLRQIHFCFNYSPTAEVFKRAFLQQQLMRNIQGLEMGPLHDQQLEADLSKLWPLLSDLRLDVGQLKGLVSKLELDPSPQAARMLIRNVVIDRGKYNINIDKACGLAIGNNARVERSGDRSGEVIMSMSTKEAGP